MVLHMAFDGAAELVGGKAVEGVAREEYHGAAGRV